jgi:hypothetical protein
MNQGTNDTDDENKEKAYKYNVHGGPLSGKSPLSRYRPAGRQGKLDKSSRQSSIPELMKSKMRSGPVRTGLVLKYGRSIYRAEEADQP